jgi:hypothetical protein
MASRIAGIAYVKVDGTQYPLRGNFTVRPSATERTGLAGQDGVHGYSENPIVPSIAGDISLTSDVSIDTIGAITNSTVVAELANGNVYTLSQAWTKAAFELNTHDGLFHVVFEGVTCTELLAQ